MPVGNQAWNLLSRRVFSSVYILVIKGLHAASTLPFAMPINNVEMKNDQNPVAMIVRIIPATWQKNAIEIILPIPMMSTSGPPKTIARVKPQKAVPDDPSDFGMRQIEFSCPCFNK